MKVVKDALGDGFVSSGSSVIKLENCVAENNGGAGLFMYHESSAIISNFRSVNSKFWYGLGLLDSAKAEVKDSVFENNKVDGIFIAENAQLVATNFRNNGNQRAGISVKCLRGSGT